MSTQDWTESEDDSSADYLDKVSALKTAADAVYKANRNSKADSIVAVVEIVLEALTPYENADGSPLTDEGCTTNHDALITAVLGRVLLGHSARIGGGAR